MIAGIDLSTHAIDIVLLDEDTDAAEWHRFELEGQDAFDRARDVHHGMPGGSFWDEVLAIGIEQPQMRGSSMKAAYSLYRVQGAVLACLPSRLLVHPLHPSEWRKQVGLPGNAPKGAIAFFVDQRQDQIDPGGPYWPQDACDAYCIALATRSLIQVEDAA